MVLILEILLIVLLSLLFFQDVKERKVSLWILISSMLIGGIIHFLNQSWISFLVSICINFSFICLVFGLLVLYAKLKMKQTIFKVFGKGDLLFFFVMAISLPLVSFIVVFVFSLLFSIVVFRLLKPKLNHKTVPLAGFQSVFLGMSILVNKLFINLDLYVL